LFPWIFNCTALSSDSAFPRDDRGNPQLEDFIYKPDEIFGNSRAAIVDRLGKPTSLDSKKFPNHHEPSVTSCRYILKYDGLQIYILDTGFDNKEILEGLILEKDFPKLLPGIRMGYTQAQVKAFLPRPYRENEKELLYLYDVHIGDHHILFQFQEDALVKVMWGYYVD
jgi:hypothetical protein